MIIELKNYQYTSIDKLEDDLILESMKTAPEESREFVISISKEDFDKFQTDLKQEVAIKPIYLGSNRNKVTATFQILP